MYHISVSCRSRVGCVVRHESEVYGISINFLLAAAPFPAVELALKTFFSSSVVIQHGFVSECDDDDGAGLDEHNPPSLNNELDIN